MIYGQEMNNPPRLFDNSQPVDIILRTDLIRLLNQRDDDNDYQPATIIIEDIKGESKEFDTEVQARGNFRRDSANCDFPPIRLNFKKKDIVDTYFEGNEKIKIVSHCKTAISEFDQFVAREYVTYRIYGLLTPISFKVRSANIIYEDTENQLDPIERIGFLIEDIDHLASRNKMKEFEESLTLTDLEKNNAILLSLFQYMIGNTDWIINMSKNLKTFSDSAGFYAVPYDFDYTMLVGTDYSLGGGKPFLSAPVRLYKGLCFDMNEIYPVAEKIRSKRKEIFELISQEKMLDYNSRQHMKAFLSEFFNVIKSENRIKENILTDCM
ncbi:MAG: hypothetical protein KFF73_11910 [Cyclobacteriaceae bacterium]|nr:hypothetical protein [Cyclobacteriaceae bacterium]